MDIVLGRWNVQAHLAWLEEHPTKKPKPLSQRKCVLFILVETHLNLQLRCRHLIKVKQIHGLEAAHIKEIIKSNHVKLKSRISRCWFTQNVF